jgi:hypothetical protein
VSPFMRGILHQLDSPEDPLSLLASLEASHMKIPLFNIFPVIITNLQTR